MTAYRILIVEDEVLIADMLARYLEKQGYGIAGIAISYEEAEQLYLEEQPDLVLIDIRLYGSQTGIDLAHFIQSQDQPRPFIYLTSQLDRRYIDLAKATFPAAYLSKPIQKESLYATIEMVRHRQESSFPTTSLITISDGETNHNIPIDSIIYLHTEHVYTTLHLTGGRQILTRRPLSELLEQLPAAEFLQTHRSFAVQRKHVQQWDKHQVYVPDRAIPLSRSRRSLVLAALKRR